MMKRLKPKDLIVYGVKTEFDYGDTNVHYYENETITRLKKIPKKKKEPKNTEDVLSEPIKSAVGG